MMQFYLDGVLLPVTPESVAVKIANKNRTLTLIGGQEVNILKRPGLSQITFTCLLPAVEYPFARYSAGFQDPSFFLDKLENLKNSAASFPFQILREGFYPSAFTVSLEDYEITEDAGEGRDVKVRVTLLQYNAYATKIVVFQEETKATVQEDKARSTAGKPSAKTYTVKKGDCLWNIAKKHLGNGARYKELITLNLATLDADAKKHGHASSSNGYWLFPGTVLKLP